MASEPAVIEAALASAQMTTHYFFNDDSLGLVGAALTAVNLAEQGGDNLPIAEIYAQLAYAAGLARLGGVARTYFAQAHATAAATRDTIGLIKTRCTEAAFAIGIGAWDDARTAARLALELSRSIRNPQESEDALTILGHVEFVSGHFETARVLAVELRDSARHRGNRQHEGWGIYTEGRAALYLGELDAAIERLDAAMPIVASVNDRASQILCGGMLACALARRGDARARSVADACLERIGAWRAARVHDDRRPRRVMRCVLRSRDVTARPGLTTQQRRRRCAARRAIAELAKLSRLLPIAGPCADNRSDSSSSALARSWRAARTFRRALAGAVRLEMPYERALARRPRHRRRTKHTRPIARGHRDRRPLTAPW